MDPKDIQAVINRLTQVLRENTPHSYDMAERIVNAAFGNALFSLAKGEALSLTITPEIINGSLAGFKFNTVEHVFSGKDLWEGMLETVWHAALYEEGGLQDFMKDTEVPSSTQ